MATQAKTKPREREILLVMTEAQYIKAGQDLERLKDAGAPSNTIAFLEALALASSMAPNPTEEGTPS